MGYGLTIQGRYYELQRVFYGIWIVSPKASGITLPLCDIALWYNHSVVGLSI